MSVREPNLLL